MTIRQHVGATVVLCLLILPVGLAGDVSAQATKGSRTGPKDPIIGTWTLNVAKSNFTRSSPI